MSDSFAAAIQIGGKISRTKRLNPNDPNDTTTVLQGLISALADDFASHDYGDVPIDCRDGEDELMGYIDSVGDRPEYLHFKCDQARNGEFENTEEFCLNNNIAFDRWSDHYCEYDAENVYFRPGMERAVVTYADANANEIVDGATVRKAMEVLDEIIKGRGLNLSVASDSPTERDVSRLLHDACPDLPPILEKINIVD